MDSTKNYIGVGIFATKSHEIDLVIEYETLF